MSNLLYDRRPFPNENTEIVEAYIGYGKTTDLQNMSNTELKQEYDRVEKEIKILKEELITSPEASFPIKERIQNAKWYKDKINSFMESEEAARKPMATSIDDMIKDLNKQLKNGVITPEYHKKYTNLLNSRRKLYEENRRRQEKMKKLKEKKEFKKNHPFKSFKSKITDYKK